MTSWPRCMILLALGATHEDADPYRSALIAAVHHFALEGEVDHLGAILDKHPDLVDAHLHFRSPHKPGRTDSFTPLQLAADYGQDKVVADLIRRGADVNARDGLGWTPLHLAARGGHLSTVKLLVEHKAKLDVKTDPVPESSGVPPGSPLGALPPPKPYPAIPGRTPLEWAVESGRAEVVAYLKALAK